MAAENGASLPLVDVVGVSKSFGHVEALRSVSFSIHESEVVALLGDNGAGKSTLVKVLAGVHRPDEGDIVKGGHPLQLRDATDALRAGIATVYQDLAVVDTLDVARNVYLGAIPRRFGVLIDYPKMYRDARQVLTALRVDLPSVHTRVRELSGGQRQAVAIARALAVEASLFLMDEPTAALGVVESRAVLELVRKVLDDGMAVIMISHVMPHVIDLADHVVVLRHGEKVADLPGEGLTTTDIVQLIVGERDIVMGGTPLR